MHKIRQISLELWLLRRMNEPRAVLGMEQAVGPGRGDLGGGTWRRDPGGNPGASRGPGRLGGEVRAGKLIVLPSCQWWVDP